MAIGNQPNVGGLNTQLADVAVQQETAAASAARLWAYVVSLGANQAAQVAGLEALGFESAANPINPGGVSDAQWFWTAANYTYAESQYYYGQPSGFNYDSALANVRGGQ
jgi:hypothetical protein